MIVYYLPAFFEFPENKCEFAFRIVACALQRPTAENNGGIF
jgi:hypothetical protein